MIYIKDNNEISKIKASCEIWKKIKAFVLDNIKPGMTTKELDDMIGNEIKKHNSTPTFYMYGEFPGNTCISVNDELIHGIPSDYKIKDGDMITFDVGVTHDGYVCDSAFTVILGKNEIAEKISKATYETLMKTIEIIKPGVCTGDLGNKTEEVAKSYGYEVIKDFSGHGCGKLLHESPSIMNYGKKDTGAPLVSGMTICIEPMLLTGSDKYFIEDNGWTVRSKNGKLTCHWEHMVLVTNDGFEILTE